MKTANRGKRHRVFYLGCLVSTLILGCTSQVPQTVPQAGSKGGESNPNQAEVFPEVQVYRCVPDEGPEEGGNLVRVIGAGFEGSRLDVLFNGQKCAVMDTGRNGQEEYAEVVSPGGKGGVVEVEVYNGRQWSEGKIAYRYRDSKDGITYSLVGQIFPEDYGPGLHVRAGNLSREGAGKQIPEVLVVADRGKVTVIRNESSRGRFHFVRDDDAVPWNRWRDGQVTDVSFLDIDEDGVDDLLYVGVGNPDDKARKHVEGLKDRLYRISAEGGRFKFTDVADGVPIEAHGTMCVTATRSLDDEGTLYVILAGGEFNSKENPVTPVADPLRILRFAGTRNDPYFVRVPVSNVPAFTRVMTDVKVLDANDDGLGDMLVTVFPKDGSTQAGAVLFINEGLDEHDDPVFWLDEDRFPESRGNKVFGSAVGDFDADGSEDVMLFFPRQVSVYQNDGSGGFTEVSDAIDWQPYHGGDKRTSHDAVILDKDSDNRPEYIVVAAQVPYILENRTPAGGDVRFTEKDLGGPDNSFIQTYTALGVVVADLDGSGFEDIVFSDSTEQNRLWRCGPDLNPIQEATSTSLPAGGAMSTRLLTGDVDQNGLEDVVAINLDFAPDIYLNHGKKGQLSDGSYLFIDVFPESAAGWDGALVDLDQDGWLDLVVAGGGWGSDARTNSIYRWDEEKGGFVNHSHALPAERLNTRGVAAGDLNRDGYPDLVFANASTPGLTVHFNCARKGEWGYFHECDSGATKSVHIREERGAVLHAVALIDYADGRPSDILVGGTTTNGMRFSEMSAKGSKVYIRIYRNNADGTFSGPETIPELSDRHGVAERFIPMNLDQPSRNGEGKPFRHDFFVAVQKGRNILLRRDGQGRFIDASERYHGGDEGATAESWGGTAGDLDGDGWDDVVTAHFPNGGGVTGLRVFGNRADAQGDRHLKEITDPVLGGYFNEDGALDALILDLDGTLDGDERPDILIANDGQNRLIIPH